MQKNIVSIQGHRLKYQLAPHKKKCLLLASVREMHNDDLS